MVRDSPIYLAAFLVCVIRYVAQVILSSAVGEIYGVPRVALAGVVTKDVGSCVW